ALSGFLLAEVLALVAVVPGVFACSGVAAAGWFWRFWGAGAGSDFVGAIAARLPARSRTKVDLLIVMDFLARESRVSPEYRWMPKTRPHLLNCTSQIRAWSGRPSAGSAVSRSIPWPGQAGPPPRSPLRLAPSRPAG